MDDLFNRVDEVDMKKVLRTAAATAAIGGAAMFGASKIPDRPPKPVPSAAKTIRGIQKGPEVTGTTVDKADSSEAPGTSKIDIDKIWAIESSKGTDPSMGRSKAGARGHFQFMKATWDEMVKKMGVDWDWRDGSMDYEKSKTVADYYINTEIPRLLKHYKIEDTVENRLAAYDWGIGNLRYNEWYDSTQETIDYIKKYRDMREDKNFQDLFQPINGKEYRKRFPPYSVTLVPVKGNATGGEKILKFPGRHNSNLYRDISKRLGTNVYRIDYGSIEGTKNWVIELEISDLVFDDNNYPMYGIFRIAFNLEDIEGPNDMRESSIDFPRPGLDKQVWQKGEEGYSLRPDVKLHILQVIGRYPNENLRAIARSIKIVGSICTNLYTEGVDIDVHIEPKQKGLYCIEGQVHLMRWFNSHRDEVNGWIGQHPIEVYLQLDPVQDLLSDGCYDILTGVWLKGPKIVPINYDPYENFKGIADEIRAQVSGADELLGELKRDAIDYDVIKAALKNLPPNFREDLLTKLTAKLQEIEDGIESLYSKRREWTKIRRDSSKPATPEEALRDVELVRQWQDANATFKFINRYQYMRVIKDLADLLEDDKISPEEVDDVKDIVGVV